MEQKLMKCFLIALLFITGSAFAHVDDTLKIKGHYRIINITPPPPDPPDPPVDTCLEADGWASEGTNTTGGCGGDTVYVSDSLGFRTNMAGSTAKVLIVSGQFRIGYVVTGSNKTVIGQEGCELDGTIRIQAPATNIILYNLILKATRRGTTDYDAIAIAGGTQVFITHCTIYDWTDGACDITKGANYVTISWCKFYMTYEYEHALAVLIGADPNDPDAGLLKVTYHHNYFGNLLIGRAPRVRFGQVHVYNNYNNAGYFNTSYIECGYNADIRAENNYFDSGEDPFIYKESGGIMYVTGSYFFPGMQGTAEPTDPGVFTPPYAYTLTSTMAVKDLVIANAGAGAP